MRPDSLLSENMALYKSLTYLLYFTETDSDVIIHDISVLSY